MKNKDGLEYGPQLFIYPGGGVLRMDDASSDNGSTHRFNQLYKDEVLIEKIKDFSWFKSGKMIQDVLDLKKDPLCYSDEIR